MHMNKCYLCAFFKWVFYQQFAVSVHTPLQHSSPEEQAHVGAPPPCMSSVGHDSPSTENHRKTIHQRFV